MGEGEGGQVPGAGPRVRGPAQLPGLKSTRQLCCLFLGGIGQAAEPPVYVSGLKPAGGCAA